MNTRFEIRLAAVWLVLSLITLGYLLVDHGADGWPLEASALLSGTVILVALVKVRLILLEFMEVRYAPVLLRRLVDLWVILTAAVLLGLYLAGNAA